MAVTALSKNLRYLVAKVESTPGTAVTPASADFDVRIWNPEMTLTVEVDDEASKDATGDHAEYESVAGAQFGQLTFQIKCPWGGAVATDPKWWKFAKMCGAKDKDYTTTGVAVTPDKSEDTATYTIWAFDVERGGAAPVTTIYKFAGCMGNMVLGAEKIGGPLTATCTVTGKLQDIVDGTAQVLTAPDTAIPEKWLSSTFTWGGSTVFCSSWALDFGNEIVPVYDQSDATGIGYFSIATRRPRFTCNPLAQKQATDDVLADVLAQTTGAITVNTTNFTIKGVDAQLLPPSLADREGFVSWDRTYKLLRNGVAGSLIDSDLTTEQTWEILQGARA
jgi:hypothetical protein